MEETVITKRREKEEGKKSEAKHILSRAINVTEVKMSKLPKRGPSIISISEASINVEIKSLMPPSLMKIVTITAETKNITLRRREVIRIEEGVFNLEQKTSKEKEVIPLSEEVPTIIPIAMKKEVFHIPSVLTPKIAEVPKVKFEEKPLTLEKEIELSKGKTYLKPIEITLSPPKVLEFIRIHAYEKEETEEGKVKPLEEIPNFFDILFEGGFGELVTVNRPICIILSKSYPESYVDSIATICRELYRIKKGGNPKPRILSTGNKEEVEKSLEAGDRIFIVDDSKCELINLSKVRKIDEINWGHLYDRLRELFSQDYGFVIFHIDEKWVDDFRSKLEKVSHMIPKLFVIKLNDLSPEIKNQMAIMCWGFVNSGGRTFDEIFCNAEKAFYDRLEEISKDSWLMHYIKPHEMGPESYEHRLLKALVVKIKAKEKGIERAHIPEKIITEYKEEGFIVDVFVNDDTKEYIEVETLYGTGFYPIGKIDHETLQRYVEKKIGKVEIVMLPLPFLIYLKNLNTLKEIYEKMHGITIEFYTVDIQNEKLISLEDVIERIKELKKQIEFSKYKKLGRELGFTEEEIKGLIRTYTQKENYNP
jgi:hypothetical protein